MEKYLRRAYDSVLEFRLSSKGAVLIEGPKWCGKTTTAEHVSNSVVYLQNPETREQNLQLAKLVPSKLLEGATPRLIDEWQEVPSLWDAVRFEVDKRGEFGQFVLTGSVVPPKLDEVEHSGTGRIARMKMRPMSLAESLDSSGEVSLADLFEGKEVPVASCSANLENLAFLACRGGWPSSVGKEEKIALQQAVDYFDALVNVDISRVDGVERNPIYAEAILRAFSRKIASDGKYTGMMADIKDCGLSISEPTFLEYISALTKLFVIEDLPAWNPNLRSKTAIRTSPTHHFVDPSIATATLGIGPGDLMNDLNTFGFVFESMCVRDLRIYADTLGGNVFHYRDKRGLECDAVVHLRDGRYGLVEIKLGGKDLIEQGAETLKKLRDNIDDSKMKAPSFLMVITGTGDFSYTREDGVLVVPIRTLGW